MVRLLVLIKKKKKRERKRLLVEMDGKANMKIK